MTVTDNYEPNYYIGNGSVSVYSFTFPVQAQTDLLVVKTDLVDSDTELAIANDYTVSLNGDGTGSIALLAGNLTTDYKLVIARKAPLSQPTDFTTRSTVAPATNQTTIDAVMLKMQQLQEEVKRCIKIPISENQTETFTELPSADSRADHSFGFDPDGRPTSVSPLDTAVPTTAWSRTLLAETSAKDGRDTLGITTIAVDTIAAMKALTTTDLVGGVQVNGYYTKGDGGGGVFYWDAASTASDNGGTIIRPSSLPASGRWIRVIENGRYNVRHFGAKGDGIADDYASINAAKNACPSGGTLFYPNGVYRITQTLVNDKTQLWLGEPGRDFFDNSWDDEGGSVIHKTTNGDAIQWSAPNVGNARIGIYIRDLLVRGGLVSGTTTTGSGLVIDGRQQPGTFARIVLDNFHCCESANYGMKIVGAVYGGKVSAVSCFDNGFTGLWVEQASGDPVGEMSWDTIRCFGNGALGISDTDKCGMYYLPGASGNTFRNLSCSENVIGAILRGGAMTIYGMQMESNSGTRQLEIGGGGNGITSLIIHGLATSPGGNYTGSCILIKGNASGIDINGAYFGDTLSGSGKDVTLEANANDVTITHTSGSHALTIDDNSGGVNFLDRVHFYANCSVAQTNVTGDGTNADVIFNNEIRDARSCYNASTGVFTAPMSGLYDFASCIYLEGIVANHDRYTFSLVTSDRTLGTQGMNINATKDAFGKQAVSCAWPRVYLDEGDTAKVQINVGNGTKVVDIAADQTYCWFSGGMARA